MFDKVKVSKVLKAVLEKGNVMAQYDIPVGELTYDEIVANGLWAKEQGLISDFKVYKKERRFGTGLVTDEGKEFISLVGSSGSFMDKLKFDWKYQPKFIYGLMAGSVVVVSTILMCAI